MMLLIKSSPAGTGVPARTPAVCILALRSKEFVRPLDVHFRIRSIRGRTPGNWTDQAKEGPTARRKPPDRPTRFVASNALWIGRSRSECC